MPFEGIPTPGPKSKREKSATDRYVESLEEKFGGHELELGETVARERLEKRADDLYERLDATQKLVMLQKKNAQTPDEKHEAEVRYTRLREIEDELFSMVDRYLKPSKESLKIKRKKAVGPGGTGAFDPSLVKGFLDRIETEFQGVLEDESMKEDQTFEEEDWSAPETPKTKEELIKSHGYYLEDEEEEERRVDSPLPRSQTDINTHLPEALRGTDVIDMSGVDDDVVIPLEASRKKKEAPEEETDVAIPLTRLKSGKIKPLEQTTVIRSMEAFAKEAERADATREIPLKLELKALLDERRAIMQDMEELVEGRTAIDGQHYWSALYEKQTQLKKLQDKINRLQGGTDDTQLRKAA